MKYEMPYEVRRYLRAVVETVQMASGSAGSGDSVPFDWFTQGTPNLKRVWAFKR